MKHPGPIAVPPEARRPGPPSATGITCPTCGGAVTAHTGGDARLLFDCRIGHIFSPPELILEKEQRLEHLLWQAVSALEELSATLRDLDLDADRRENAAADAEEIRAVIQRTRTARVGQP